MIVIGLLAVAYLLGSTPTSLLLARARGIDLREWGSGNLGATNLYRAAGFPLAALCTIADVGKGFVPARFFAGIDGMAWPQLALAYGIAAVLGHVFSIWVGFRGGKGMATGAGVYLAVAPAAVGLAALVWLIVVAGVRIVSVGSLAAATVFPAFVWLTGHRGDYVFWSSIPVALFVWWTHRTNLYRLRAGKEPRTSRGSGAPQTDVGSGEAPSEA
jgi:glycerol-3-phosphate acyltransferase PlsY